MTFILAEKPSVAEAFARALGAVRKDGYYQDADYTVTNCIGHLLSLYDAQDYDEKYKKWNAADLPIVPETFKHKPSEKTARQLALVKNLLAKTYDRYVIATDAGREGELIARLVFQYAGITGCDRVFRFWTSSALTKEVIRDSLENVKPASAYDDLYYAGLYRQLSDWLVGINFSRFFSVKLNNKFIFGRVQTPVLNMIVTREKAIRAFTKSFFYRLRVTVAGGDAAFYSHLVCPDGDVNTDDRAALESLKDRAPGTSVVRDVAIERKTQHPPRLFDLTELQKTANARFGYTSQKTLELAQTLYEKYQCLSYPRTASRYVSRINYDLFVQCLDTLGIAHGDVDVQNTNVFNDEAMERNKEDHHALLLLKTIPEAAAEEEKNIFNLVLHNMTNVVKDPYVYEAITVTHTRDDLTFMAKGIKVINPGWKDGGADDGEDEEEEQAQALPDLRKDDTVVIKDAAVTQHERKPPRSFTEAALLTAMKKYGLGTVATRDTIIEGLIKNEYCFRKGKNVLPSDKAFFFIDTVMGLGHDGLQKYLDVANTKEWEDMLENEPAAFFERMKAFIADTIGTLKEQTTAMQVFQNTAGSCPVCGAPVIPGKHSYYCANYKTTGCDFSIGRVICGAAVTEADIKALLAGKKSGLKSMQSKAGKAFKAYVQLDKDHKIRFEFKDPKKEAKK
ncbi:MAG: topoisomerase C-terminal repeat-containing protein [Treponema sp.]|jgi:DNA topoisomerase-3|nr:topoisomerase C-terminal repeat-containing protein [Treponema sp.]